MFAFIFYDYRWIWQQLSSFIISITSIDRVRLECKRSWRLDKLVNGWMRIIGIEPNIPAEKNNLRWILWFIQRWTCFFFSLGVNVCILISVFFKNKEENDTKTNSTTRLNEWMDYIVITSIQAISIHLRFLLVISPH